MTELAAEDITGLEDHWRWRPEWATDRPCLWWYLTFEGQPALRWLSDRVRPFLDGMSSVDAVPPQWLHLTVQDVGFVDEVSPGAVQSMLDVASKAVADLQSQPLTLGPVSPMRSAVVLPQQPADHLRGLRRRLREAMAAVGMAVPGPDEFRPHVSLGYLNRDCDARTVMDRLRPVRSLTTTVQGPRLTLAAVTRRGRHYQWTSKAELRLAPAGGDERLRKP